MRNVPGAVAVVATAFGGERNGLAVTAWNSLSADPPLLLACINRRAGAHDLLISAGAFSINLLSPDYVETVAVFAGQRGLSGSQRFEPGAWEDGPLGQPMFSHAIASFECELEDAHEHGTHTILIGKVGAMASRDDVSALLYVDGRYTSAMRFQGD